MNTLFDWDEVTSLIQLLRSEDILYLVGEDVSPGEENETIDPLQLILRVAACGYPLVENAVISLFILHPEFAPIVVTALECSEPDLAERIAVLTLATLYLQQWWFFRLTFALGRLPNFPDAPFASLWEERHLPPPVAGYGMDGLLSLQRHLQRQYGLPLNFLDDWQNQITHLLQQEEARHRPLSEDMRQTLVQLSIEKKSLHVLS